MSQHTSITDAKQNTINEAKLYWQNLLSHITNPSVLGIKKTRSKEVAPSMQVIEITLASQLGEEIKHFIKANQLALPTLLYGAWGYLLSYYCGSPDVIFGSMTLGSDHVHSSIILPIQVSIVSNQTVLNYLDALQKQQSASHRNKHALTQEILLWNHHLSLSLFDHVFICADHETNEMFDTSSFSLSITVIHTDQMKLSVHYDENSYSSSDIKRVLLHFQELLKAMIYHSTRSLTELSLLSMEERQTILFDWNQTESPYSQNKTIQQWFEEHAEKNPSKVALILEANTMTYLELNEKANVLAHHLRTLGVKRDTFVAISMEPSFDLMIGILGILKAGGAYLPLDPNYPKERLQFILQDAKASILITQSKLTSHFDENEIHLICLDSEIFQMTEYTIKNPLLLNESHDLAYVIYTSGSTGKPKGVMISHRNVNHFFHWFSKALSITSDDIVDFSSSISFDFSVASTLFPLSQGATIAIYPEINKRDPYLHINYLHQNKVSIIKLTPSHFRQLKEFVTNEYLFPDLRYIIFGGEPLYAKDLNDWLAQYPHHHILAEYGPTEATVATSWLKIDRNNIHQFENMIPIGRPALNSKLYILNKNLQPLPVRIAGELYIGGEGVARGYLNQPEITDQRFIHHSFCDNQIEILYKTGDLCRYLSDGNIEFIERIDHQVKIRGFRIELDEIQQCLSMHPAIKEVIVLAQNDSDDSIEEKRLIAYFIPKNSKVIPSLDELHHYAQLHLPEYMIPMFFVMIKSFPLSPNGKLDRHALPQPILHANQSLVEPRSLIEHMIRDIWSDVLNLKDISIDDNFFELGGHSLSATRIISKIRKSIKKDVKLQDLYDAPTIAEFACIISHANNTDEIVKQSIKQDKYLQSNGIPLSDMQLLLWLAEKSFSKSKALNIVDRIRLSGHLDVKALKFALECILKKHPILCYYISSYLPKLYPQSKISFNIIEENISHLSEKQIEEKLLTSATRLKTSQKWKKGLPLIITKLFYLSNNSSELQICLSHMISDEVSPQIILSDLSKYYLDFQSNITHQSLSANEAYKNYIIFEQENLNILKRDIQFWETYLNDVDSFLFPISSIIKNTNHQDFPGSIYIELPDKYLNQLKTFCMGNKLSITDSLCAAIGLAVVKYTSNYDSRSDSTIAINCVKSTRDNDIYDHSVGFFVRTDVIKMNINKKINFTELSKSIQKSVAETAPYQFCPSVIKLGYLYKKHWTNKKLAVYFLNKSLHVLAKIFHKSQSHPLIAAMYANIFFARTKQNFLVNVNILNNFIHDNPIKDMNLFGLKQKNIRYYHTDRTIADHVVDITFERNNQNKVNLIVSGNLKPEFREALGTEIITIIKHHTTGKHKKE